MVSSKMLVADQIKALLTRELNPTQLEIINDSHKHAGHAGSPDSGESHFTVTVVSDKFFGLSSVKRHQLVYTILAELLEGPIHALSLRAFAPNESCHNQPTL